MLTRSECDHSSAAWASILADHKASSPQSPLKSTPHKHSNLYRSVDTSSAVMFPLYSSLATRGHAQSCEPNATVTLVKALFRGLRQRKAAASALQRTKPGHGTAVMGPSAFQAYADVSFSTPIDEQFRAVPAPQQQQQQAVYEWWYRLLLHLGKPGFSKRQQLM